MLKWSAAFILAGFLAATTAAAESCPNAASLDKTQLRAQAERWFSRGELAARDDRGLEALYAFQCSLRLFPHAFTAYNLAQVAESVGDVQLAVASYEKYLLLSPAAKDAAAIESKTAELRARLDKVASTVSPDPAAVAASAPAIPVAAAPAPSNSVQESVPARSGMPWMRTVGWSFAASTAALAGTALVFNFAARSNMSDCRLQYFEKNYQAAQSSCSSGQRNASVSYALFGASAAAGATAAIMILLPTTPASVAANDGGFTVAWTESF